MQAIGQIEDVNIYSHTGETALYYAISEWVTTGMNLLLVLKANVSLQDNDGNTVLVLAYSICDDESHSKLTIIFQLYKHGVI